MQDAPELRSQIQSLNKPEHKNLIRLAENYHNAVCEGEKCIIYEKKTKVFKVLPELVVGAIKYSNIDNISDKLYSHLGIIGHVWMPQSNEKLYFRTGIMYSNLDFGIGNENTSVIKVPCQLEYIYSKGIIRPRIAYGFNFYTVLTSTVALDIGGNLRLSETLFLSLSSGFEFHPVGLIIPDGYLSGSLSFGLLINLN